ncbi:alpha/beta hydrolase [Rhodococcus sp. C26F]
MDIEFADVLAQFPALQFEDPHAQRAAMRSAAAQSGSSRLPADVTVHRVRTVRSPDGYDIPVIVYTSVGMADDAATLLWMHGGGYVIGSAEEDDALCARLASDLGIAVVSVDYRLAPEYPFPTGFDDCCAVAYALADAGMREDAFGYRGGDTVLIGGASAGAGLAAAVALRLRDEGLGVLDGQILLYPFIDSTLSTHSMVKLADSHVFNAHDAEVCWEHYLGDRRHSPTAYASPCAAEDLTGLPPAYVAAAGLDCLHDEAIEYAFALMRAGVDVELHSFPGVPHGFTALVPGASASRRAIADMFEAVRRMAQAGAPRAHDTLETIREG